MLIEVFYGSKDGNTESLTNTQDGDAAQYFPPGS